MRCPSPRRARLVVSLLTFLTVTTAAPAQLQWGPNGSGGDGIWTASATTLNWYNGTTNVAWDNATPASAAFGGPAGTVTIDNSAGNLQVAGLTFSTTGYVLTGGTLTLAGTAPTIALGASATDIATINAALAGAAPTVSGSGILVLGGSNTFTGTMTISAGTVRLANAGALNSTTPIGVAFGSGSTGTLQLNGNSVTIAALTATSSASGVSVQNASTTAATLTVNQSTDTIFQGVISDGTGGGALSLLKTGTGTLTMNSSNTSTFTGSVTVTGGTLSVNSDSRLGTAPGSATVNKIVVNGAAFQFSTANTLNSNRGIALGPVSGTGTGSLDFSTTGTATYNGIIANNTDGATTGTGSLVIKNSNGGTVQFGGVSTFTGTMTIENGAVALTTGNNRLPTATALVLGGAATNTSGKLITGTSSAARTQQLASLVTAGTGTGNAVVGAFTSPSTLTLSFASGTVTYNGNLGGSGTNENQLNLTKSGAGTLVLGGSSTIVGTTSVTAGTLQTAVSNALSAVSPLSLSNVAGVTLNLNNTTQSVGSLTGGGTTGGNITLGAGTLTVGGDNTSPAAYGGVITGSGTLSKVGTGTLTLSGANTSSLTGPVNVTGGAISIAASTNLGSTGTVTLDGGTLRQTNPTSGGITFLSATRALVVGPNGGTLDYSPSGTDFSVVAIYAPNAAMTGAGNTLTKTGPGEFRYNGTDRANTTFTRLVVNQGLYRLGSVSTAADTELGFGAAPPSFLADAITINGGSIGVSFNATLHNNRGITLGPNGGSFNTSAGSIMVPGAVTGAGSLNKGTGTLTLQNANSDYAGGTTIAGTLSVASLANGGATSGIGASSSAAGNLVLNGGTLSYTGGAVSTDRLFSVTSAGGTISASGTGPVNFTNTGANLATDKAVTNFTLNNTSTFALLATTGTPFDLIGLAVGMPVTGAGIPANTTVSAISTTLAQFTLSAAATATTANTPLTFTSLNRTLTLTGSNTGANAIAGSLADSPTKTLALTKAGAGTWALTGTNTYTGVTTVSAGILLFGKQTALYNNNPASWTVANIIVSSGAILAFNAGGPGEFTSGNLDTLKALGSATGGFLGGSKLGIDTTNAGGSFTYGSTITDTNGNANSLGLVKLGTGTLALTATNTYTGGTTVSGGTLQVNGQTGTNSGTGGGSVTISSGAVLGGTGVVGGTATGGDVILQAGATLNPGAGNVGMLTALRNVTLNGGTGSTWLVGINSINNNDPAANPLNLSNANAGAGVLNFVTSSAPYTIQFEAVGTQNFVQGTQVTYNIAMVATSANVQQNGVAFGDGTTGFSFRSNSIQFQNAFLSVSGNNLQLSFTPVPEPAAVLGLYAGTAGAAGWWRRRRG